MGFILIAGGLIGLAVAIRDELKFARLPQVEKDRLAWKWF
jgi:hypothetical protein